MSTWFEEAVSCPACGVAIQARLARGIHAARAPEVRDQLFARTFHRVTCVACAITFTAQRAFVYTDTERKHWLQVAPAIERPRWPELEPATEALFDRAFTGAPLALEIREGMKLRLVFGLEELREKLVLWRANLDDATVECLKAQLLAHQPRLMRARTIVVDAVTAGALELVVDDTERFVIPAALVERYHDDPRLPDRFPELFGGRYISLFRLTGPRFRWAQPAG
ncbi:MAG: CpXC domain-containing protein [Myxococcota bacterium]|nr:CpXC domain-containing protein [Myxococcota bacterium]